MGIKKLSIFTLVFASLISGCSKSAPACSDTETIKLVRDIARTEMTRLAGAEKARSVFYSVDAIRTTGSNKETGSNSCAAQMKLLMNGPFGIPDPNAEPIQEFPIAYTVELTDKENEFYVTVEGL